MSDQDFDRQVRRLYGEQAEDQEAADRALARLRAEMVDPDHRPSSPRRRWRIVAAATSALVIAIGTVTVLQRPSATAAAFERYSNLAASTPAPTTEAYVADRVETMRVIGHTEIGSGAEFEIMVRSTIDRQLQDDGSVRTVETVHDVSFVSDEDRQTWIELGRPAIPEKGDVKTATAPVNNGINTGAISTDPTALLEALRSGEIADHPPGDDQTFLLIADLLTHPGLSSDQRSALYQAAASLDGVNYLGAHLDPLGRVGEAFSLVGEGEETIIVVDPETGAPLSTEMLQDGHPIEWTAFDTPASG
jgi:hypothetical protein